MILSKIKPFFRLNFITFFIIVNILLLFSQTPTFIRFLKTPQDRIFPFVHTDWAHDYYLYLAAINQGINGDLLYHDPYTTESTSKGIFYIFFTLAGQIAKIFHLNPVITYHLLTLISFEMFIIFVFLISQVILGKKYAFWAGLFSIIGTISPTLLWNLKIDFPLNMPWFLMMDAFERLYALPHYNFSQALLLASIILFIKFFRTRRLKYAYLSSLIIFIAGLILPSVLIPIVTALPASYLLYLLLHHYSSSDPPAGGESRSLPEAVSRGSRQVYLERSRETRTINPYVNILKGIGLVIGVSLIVYLIIKSQVQAGFPWNHWVSWGLMRWNMQEPTFDRMLLLSFGILPILSIPAIYLGFKKGNFILLFTSIWALLPFILLPFVDILGIPKIRLVQEAPFVPFGILAAYTIFEIIPERIMAIGYPKIPILKDTNSMYPIDRSFLGDDTWRDAFAWAKGEHRNLKKLGVSLKFGIEGAVKIFQYAIITILLMTTLPVNFNILNQRIAYTQNEPVYDHIYIPKTSYAAIEYIKNNLPKNSAILSHEKYGIIIPAFAPVISYFGHPNQTFNYFEKEKNIQSFFSKTLSDNEAQNFLYDNGIKYIYSGWQEKELGGNIAKYPFLKPVFQNTEVVIYKFSP